MDGQLVKHIYQTLVILVHSIFLSNGGDTCEGTGLSDATPIKCTAILESTKFLPWNSYTIGNHDLGQGNLTMQYLEDMFNNGSIQIVIASNIFYLDGMKQYGLPYKYETLDNGARILNLGAMYGSGQYSDLYVTDIVKQMQSQDMQQVFEQYGNQTDVVVINCHIGHDDAQLPEIHSFLRNQFQQYNPKMPIVILSAHSHRVIYNNTDACENDQYCYSFEAGCYMKAMQHVNISIDFDQETNKSFIANVSYYDPAQLIVANYSKRFGLTEEQYPTEYSNLIHDYIVEEQAYYGINTVMGYSKFYYEEAISDINVPGCLAKLYFKTAFDSYIVDFNDPQQLTLCAYGTVRAPLYKGNITQDDINSVLPFGNSFMILKNIKCEDLNEIISMGNEDYTRFALFKQCEAGKYYNLLTDSYNGPNLYYSAQSIGSEAELEDYDPIDQRLSSTSQLFQLFVHEQMQEMSYTQKDIKFCNQDVLLTAVLVFSILMYAWIFYISDKQISLFNTGEELTQSYDVLAE